LKEVHDQKVQLDNLQVRWFEIYVNELP
jgi:hypothetical protein